MGKLKVIKSSPLATIQDKGRFGHRKYGIPQSGAMDFVSMEIANSIVSNPVEYPVLEFALMGLKLEALEETIVGIVGSDFKVNSQSFESKNALLFKGDILEISPPHGVYSYLAIGGLISAKEVLNSYSTYLLGSFGGFDGRSLKPNDLLYSKGEGNLTSRREELEIKTEVHEIRCMKGPEWSFVKEQIEEWHFKIDPSSNRMGIRLSGTRMPLSINEIQSSAVVPGTIQVPSNGHPVILMNDCQTTGGYPRVGKVLNEDLPKLTQAKPNSEIKLIFR